jgi:hypothetical protein
MAEAHFTLRNVTDPVEKFLVIVTALAEQQADRVKHIIERQATATSYGELRTALIASHTMTPFQQVDRLMNMESLGYRKPTGLLAEMVKFRPSKDHHFFAYLFLQRLRKEVRVLLARDDCKDMQALAEKADGLMALHTHQGQEVAAIAADRPAAAGTADEDDFVAAINKGRRKQQQFKKKGFKKQNQGKQRKEFESLQSPLCYYHVRFCDKAHHGDKAHHCDEPSAWPAEN